MYFVTYPHLYNRSAVTSSLHCDIQSGTLHANIFITPCIQGGVHQHYGRNFCLPLHSRGDFCTLNKETAVFSKTLETMYMNTQNYIPEDRIQKSRMNNE